MKSAPAPECRFAPAAAPEQSSIEEVAAWLIDRLRDELASPGSSREGGIREILGSNGRNLLQSPDAASLVRELRAVVLPTYSASSERQEQLMQELAEARATLNVERQLVFLVDSLDARLSARS